MSVTGLEGMHAWAILGSGSEGRSNSMKQFEADWRGCKHCVEQPRAKRKEAPWLSSAGEMVIQARVEASALSRSSR